MASRESSQVPRILVAVSDPIQRVMLRSWLTDGYELIVTPTGEGLLEKAREQCPDAVILAAALPGISGVAATWVLKNDPRYGLPPTAILVGRQLPATDGASPDDREIWTDGLADAHLLEPLDREQVMVVVAKLLCRGVGTDAVLDVEADDRRLWPRRPVDITAEIAWEQGRAEGRILSLSPRGAFVRSDQGPEPGTTVALSFASESGPISAEGEILYRNDAGDCPGVGLQFGMLSSATEVVLLDTLKAAC